jgi:CRISPR-associated protein Csb1
VPTVEQLKGGVTIDHAVQTTVLSLPAIRRLRFPVDGEETPERNNAARTVLAALGLVAIAHVQEQGYDLRSRCLLIADGLAPLELIANDGQKETFELNVDAADKIFEKAVTEAKRLGLPWHDEAVKLVPDEQLIQVVKASREAKSSAGE